MSSFDKPIKVVHSNRYLLVYRLQDPGFLESGVRCINSIGGSICLLTLFFFNNPMCAQEHVLLLGQNCYCYI